MSDSPTQRPTLSDEEMREILALQFEAHARPGAAEECRAGVGCHESIKAMSEVAREVERRVLARAKAEVSDDEISEYFTPKHIELLAHLGFEKDSGRKISYGDARWLMMRATEDALHNYLAAMAELQRRCRSEK